MTRLLTALVLSFGAAMGATFVVAQTSDTIDMSVTVTGSMDYQAYQSASFEMSQEAWRLRSDFTQSTEFTVLRPAPDRIGGAPSAFFSMMREGGDDLYQPILSPFDPFTRNFTGEIRVTGCAPTTISVAAGMPSQITAAGFTVNLPAGMDAVDKGTVFVQACSRNRRMLVFYLPPAGMYNVPETGPLACTPEYAYEQAGGPSAMYDPSLVDGRYAASLEAACPGHPREPSESMAFMGSVDWDEFVTGTTFTFDRTDTGLDGTKGVADEPWRELTVRLRMELHAH